MMPSSRTEGMIELMKEAAAALGQVPPTFASTGEAQTLTTWEGCLCLSWTAVVLWGGGYHSNKEYLVLSSIEQRFQLILKTITAIAGR